MNLVDLLSKELAQTDWSTLEKARYLYIRCCELFTYDPRYQYCSKISNGSVLKQEILNKKIDLTKVSDDWIVCTSHINEVYIKLLEILLGIYASPKKLRPTSDHVWAQFTIHDQEIKADSAIKSFSDLSRVKMKLQTQEFKPVSFDKKFDDELEKIDLKIRYIENEYEEVNIMRAQQEFIDHCNLANLTMDESLIYKWSQILVMLRKYANIKYSLNEHLCLNYLILHLLNPRERERIKITELYQMRNFEDWSFARIYSIYLSGETLFYFHFRYQNQFSLYPISQAQAIQYMSKMNLAYDHQKEYVLNRKLA